MLQVNRIQTNAYKGLNSGSLFSTKRAPIDTSELYIKSSLNQIYNRTVADCFVKQKLGSIKNFVDSKPDRNMKLA